MQLADEGRNRNGMFLFSSQLSICPLVPRPSRIAPFQSFQFTNHRSHSTSHNFCLVPCQIALHPEIYRLLKRTKRQRNFYRCRVYYYITVHRVKHANKSDMNWQWPVNEAQKIYKFCFLSNERDPKKCKEKKILYNRN